MYTKLRTQLEFSCHRAKWKCCSLLGFALRADPAAGFIHTRENEHQFPYLNEPVFSIS